ncbi:hypothetical protein B0H13DRAFT_1911874 [Mycena leptocephala]|nr:hypothetical protein B0H13DRAFT_1911874 [Mycena leptocephala]
MPGSPFSTPSPLTPCPPSPRASTLGKRKAAQIEEGDDDSDGDDDEARKTTTMIRTASSTRTTFHIWYYDAEGGPPMTKNAGELLSRLLWVYGRITERAWRKYAALLDKNRPAPMQLALMLTVNKRIQGSASTERLEGKACRKVPQVKECRTTFDIYCLATAIREVRHGMWLPQVRRMMVPIHYMRSVSGYIQTLELKYNSPVKVGEPPNLQVFRFADITTTDQVFTAIQTNLPILPKRSQEWDFPQSPPLWKPVGGPNHINVLKPITIKSPIELGPNTKKCPQRNIAEVAPLATSIDDLRAKLQDRQEGYVEVNSDVIQPDEALFIRDLNDKLLALLFKVPDEYREGLKAAVDHINTVLEGEFKDADSREEAFKYLSLHYSWYARYAEQGHSAPKDVHCNKSRKTKRGRVNMTQRTPHPSKNMVDKPGEYAVLATAFTDFFELLHVSLESLLPDDTDELSMYVEELPLHASSLVTLWRLRHQHQRLQLGPS